MQNRTLFFGDNLEILREKVPDEIFDLIYLDPPFNSNRNYNVIFKEGLQESSAQIHAFEDSWHWNHEAQRTFDELVRGTNQATSELMQALRRVVGERGNDMLAYLTMMTARLIELHRVLKKTGSIYLHCDPTASHYLKIVMDTIFGKQNFRNEIIWHYTGGGRSKNYFSWKHDTILCYSSGGESIFNVDSVRVPYKDTSGYAKEGIVAASGKRYMPNPLGTPLDDVWDIPIINPLSKERLGYPTQKPEALLEWIIKASSNEGDWVLDPFCGCGTTVAVAERLKRNWVGMDISMLAVNLIKHRLEDHHPGIDINVDGIPKDIEGARALFAKDPFQFEHWTLDLVGARPGQNKTKEKMRGADKGIDGVSYFIRDIANGEPVYGKLIIQVKGGGAHRNDIATLKGDIERERADGGIFITLEKATKPMHEEVAGAGSYSIPASGTKRYPKIQITTIEELLEGKRLDVPSLIPYYKQAERRIESGELSEPLL